MAEKDKILLFGGTFNPIHNGHLIMAQEAIERLSFNEVIFIPSATPPHKKDVLNVSHRLKMVKLATYEVEYFTVSDIEEKREGLSYTFDTIRHFKELRPNAMIYWLIGTDTLPELKTWYKIEELVHECRFLIAERNPYKYYKGSHKDLFSFIAEETKSFLDCEITDHFTPLVNSVIEISSTDIRNKVINDSFSAIRFLVPEKVEQYIDDCDLYKDKLQNEIV